jgi:two-component system nitrate/nitrite sensor histidine kinase NarX
MDRNQKQSATDQSTAVASGNNLFQAIAENMDTHLAYLDLDFNFVWVNSAYALGSGHSKEELIGRNHFELFPNPENQAIFEQVRETGNAVTFDAKPFEFVDQPERGITYWNWSLMPHRDVAGQAQGLVFSLQDVTEREQAEARLREQNEFITKVFESLAHPFYVVDANDYTVKIANSVAHSGELPEAIKCYALTHGRSTPCADSEHYCPLEEVKKTHKAVIVEHTHVDNTGQQRIYEVHGHPIFDAAGTVKQVIEYTIDVTDRKNAEQALQQRTRDLRERVKELNCLYSISSLAETPGISLAEILQGTADLIPPAWEYPEFAGARITLEEQEFRTDQFIETAAWQESVNIIMQGKPVGAIEVSYAEEMTFGDEGPFLQEERSLLNAIAEHLGRTIERTRGEAALRTSEERWRSITEHSPDYISLLDRDANIRFVNHTIPGLTKAEVIGTSFYDYALPEFRRRTQECFERVLRSSNPDRFESVYQYEDGTCQFFESHVGPVLSGDTVVGLTVSSRDVTDRKKVDQALQRERDFISTILDTARVLVIVLDPQGRIIQFNRACEALTGYRFNDVRHQIFWDLLLTPEEIQSVKAVFNELRAGQFPNEFENYWVTKEDQRRLIAWSNSAIVSDAGMVEYIIGTGIDITEQRQAEQALRDSEKKYRQLIELAQEGIWVIDPEANTTFVNPRMAEMLDYSVDEMIGKHLFSFMDERGVEISTRNLERRRQGIQEQHDFEFLRKDGTRIYTSLETSPIMDENGNYAGALAVVADISDRKQAEDALSTLLEISRQVALTTELAPLLDAILDQLRNVVDYDDATIFGLDGETVTALAHKDGGWQDDNRSRSFKLGQSALMNSVILDQAVTLISDTQGDALRSRDLADTGAETADILVGPARSWLGVPLMIKERVIGILTLQHNEPGQFTPRQADLARAFADQAVVAIENTRLYEQAQALAAVEERQRLARDLHDAVSQTLFSASLAADVLPKLWESKPEAGKQCLEELRLLTKSALAEMRTLLLELRPAALTEVELSELLRQLVEAAIGRGRVPITFESQGKFALPPDVHITLYRITQEALNNIVNHASANHAALNLWRAPDPSATTDGYAEKVKLQIQDDGQGFDPDAIPADSLGLGIMRERAASIGADIKITSQLGQGTHIAVIWPRPT